MTRYAVFLLVLGCKRPSAPLEAPAYPTAPSEATPPAECFKGPFPVLVTQRGSLPEACFHLKTDPNGVVQQTTDPTWCSGQTIPQEAKPMDSFREEPYTTQRYGCSGDCDYNAIDNVIRYAEQHLWPIVTDHEGSYGRAPCGGEATCSDLYGETVGCFITVTDCDMDPGEVDYEVSPPKFSRYPILTRTYRLDCAGTRSCRFEGRPPEECCQVSG